MGIFEFRKKGQREPKEERAENLLSLPAAEEPEERAAIPEPVQEERAETTAAVTETLLRALLGTGTADKHKALEIPAFAGCLDYIASTISMIPIKLYCEEWNEEKKGKVVTEMMDDQRVKLLNDETGDTLDAVQFWKALVTDYFLDKGGYAYIRKEGNRFTGIHYVNAEAVGIQKNADPIFKDYQLLVNGRIYRPYEFLKILRNTRDGARGISIVEENPTVINVGYNTLKFENSLVKKGGNKRGFLQSEKQLDQPTLDLLRDAWNRLYGDNEENVMILNNGVTFKEASNTSVEMQLNENKETNFSEICTLMNVPEGILKGTATAEQYATGFKLAVMPIIRTIECALNRDFLLEKEKRGSKTYYWAFDTKEITKGDIKTRYEAYKTAIEANFMQADEVRYLEDMEPMGLEFIKLGLNDVLYYPKTGEIYTPNTNKTMKRGETIEN